MKKKLNYISQKRTKRLLIFVNLHTRSQGDAASTLRVKRLSCHALLVECITQI